jgi:hypothetical protein
MNLAALAAVAVFCGSAERFWTVTQVDARPALDGRGGA